MSGRGDDAITTIPLRKATRDRLKTFGGKGETYDVILNRLMDLAKTAAPVRRQPPPEPAEPSDLVDFEPVD